MSRLSLPIFHALSIKLEHKIVEGNSVNAFKDIIKNYHKIMNK
jgi:hypothetical protein